MYVVEPLFQRSSPTKCFWWTTKIFGESNRFWHLRLLFATNLTCREPCEQKMNEYSEFFWSYLLVFLVYCYYNENDCKSMFPFVFEILSVLVPITFSQQYYDSVDCITQLSNQRWWSKREYNRCCGNIIAQSSLQPTRRKKMLDTSRIDGARSLSSSIKIYNWCVQIWKTYWNGCYFKKLGVRKGKALICFQEILITAK